ncbi:MAG: hypothetical protein NC453_19880 [Muribaculum sp.]|nr:hypothetical protein [Muribaculum sp.]
MTNRIFYSVAYLLLWAGEKCRLTYNEVNILVYYLLIPLSWCIMLDCWIGLPITSIALLLIWIGIFIMTRRNFRQWCDMRFMDSVDFLNWFNRWGGNYILNSVIICVALPLIIYAVLITLLLLK